MSKKNILCITGTRADYGIYRPLLLEMEKSADFNLSLLVTGMHLLKEYGETITHIKRDQLHIVSTPSILMKGDDHLSMAQSLGVGILSFSHVLAAEKPDYLLVLGDRGEMLAAATVAHYLNIPIVHFHGGEVSGSADDAIRHAITKLAHLHFVSSEKSKNTLLRLGEEEWRIHVIGSLRKTEIEHIKRMDTSQKQELQKKYNLPLNQPFLLVAFHPDSRDELSPKEQVHRLLRALEHVNEVILFIGANSDAGGEYFNDTINQFCRKHHQRAFFYASVPQEEYLFLLQQADALIGNSSSGLIEAPFFNLPYVLVGNRQKGRERGSNVMETPYEEKEIYAVIQNRNSVTKQQHVNPYDVLDCPEKHVLHHLKQPIDHWAFINKRVGE
ncbi:UDP-N-acetylglucosamine 2-epimerase [Metabacillus iocasae]|uniref:UDP-hydrolyzing UDP-N-acetyl-D-glucosamine 2-epimerase n=1 Tax=Priestia iocasae TaxID=2291674 RepID=A0ABS2QUA9_9BACI|nr:UDP-N-acetylglucosamine 2-epimerase [Metabacillus iocasae]MBM7703019.1 UDP-hydrolyzing UDP-N-acetyl-D-glucosamine 2-epimerase [Metabacillus iocasae]